MVHYLKVCGVFSLHRKLAACTTEPQHRMFAHFATGQTHQTSFTQGLYFFLCTVILSIKKLCLYQYV